MYSLNRATILGNVTRDPETRQIPSGQSVCTFSIATNRSWTDGSGQRQEQVEFHNVVAWGKLAEICSQYMTKGKKVYVEGRLQTRDWEGQDGVKRYRTEIILLDRPGTGSGSPFGGNSVSSPNIPPLADDPGISQEPEIKVEDIPF